jgi:hypothetical protein
MKKVKDLFNRNYKSLKKEIREDGKTPHAYGSAESILNQQ